MSVWSTRSSGRDLNFVVMKHTVPNINYNINGVKFRAGYAVIAKPSKLYTTLKRLPTLKNAREFPITFLDKLPFITRTIDIKIVYGMEVYDNYLRAKSALAAKEEVEQKVEEVKQHLADKTKCQYKTKKSQGEELCSHDAVENSTNSYCLFHILEDPKVQELGIEVPKFMTKNERKQLRNKVADQIRASKKGE